MLKFANRNWTRSSTHINNVDQNIKFTQEGMNNGTLAFLDCAVTVQEDGSLNTTVYRKATHTDQYLLFDSHHPLIHKLGVIRTLFHRADNIPSTENLKQGEKEHLKSALGVCGYKSWTFQKALKNSEKSQQKNTVPRNSSSNTRRYNTTIPYISGLSEKIRRIYRAHNLQVSFKPGNTLRQQLVHPKDKTPRHKQQNIVYGFKCVDKDCEEAYIGETKQPMHKRMYQHRRPSSTGLNDSAIYSHLKTSNHSFEDKDITILDKEQRWFERGVKEAIYVRREQPSLNRGGGLRFNLRNTYDPAIRKIQLRLSRDSSTPSRIKPEDHSA